MATTTYKVAAAAYITDPDDKGRWRNVNRGGTVEVDPANPRVAVAIDRGLLIDVDAPLPPPSSPAQQRRERLAATDEAATTIETPPTPYADVLAGSVEEVLAYLADHPNEVDAVVAAEAAGQARRGITDR